MIIQKFQNHFFISKSFPMKVHYIHLFQNIFESECKLRNKLLHNADLTAHINKIYVSSSICRFVVTAKPLLLFFERQKTWFKGNFVPEEKVIFVS